MIALLSILLHSLCLGQCCFPSNDFNIPLSNGYSTMSFTFIFFFIYSFFTQLTSLYLVEIQKQERFIKKLTMVLAILNGSKKTICAKINISMVSDMFLFHHPVWYTTHIINISALSLCYSLFITAWRPGEGPRVLKEPPKCFFTTFLFIYCNHSDKLSKTRWKS